MARIRTIKPEFWTAAQVIECSPNARLLFIGLWNFCDDCGRHVDNSRQVKAEIFPADDFTSENIRGMIDELSGAGLIKRYVVEGIALLQVTGWHHQRIDRAQRPRYPGPDGDNGDTVRGTFEEHSRRKGREGKGGEGKGMDTKGVDEYSRSPPDPDAKPGAQEPTETQAAELDPVLAEFSAVYPAKAGEYDWPAAWRALEKRVDEGHTYDEVIDGAKRYAAFCRAMGWEGSEFVKKPATFIGSGDSKPFREAWAIPAGISAGGETLTAAQQAKRELFS